MKKVFWITLSVLVLSACAPIAQSFVPLPEAERLGITALVVAAVGWAFTLIGSYLPFTVPFLVKYKDEVSVSLSALLVGFIENALPAAYPDLSILVVQLVLAAVAAYGLFKFLGKRGVKSFRA